MAAVVQRLERGELKPERALRVGEVAALPLPAGDEDLAEDHQVRLYRPTAASALQVEFVTSAGCLGDCSTAYAYVSDDSEPQRLPSVSDQTVRRLEPHWFWVTSP
jgi:hypothetical protein